MNRRIIPIFGIRTIVIINVCAGVDGRPPEQRATGRRESTVNANESGGARGRAPLRRAPRSLSSLIAGYKSSVTSKINQIRGTPGAPMWQRNYNEHIIRNEFDYSVIRLSIKIIPVDGRWTTKTINHAAWVRQIPAGGGRRALTTIPILYWRDIPAPYVFFVGCIIPIICGDECACAPWRSARPPAEGRGGTWGPSRREKRIRV